MEPEKKPVLPQILPHPCVKSSCAHFSTSSFRSTTRTIWWCSFHSFFPYCHNVWKLQKRSHLTLRAKRVTFTFWMDKSLFKMPIIVYFGEFWNPEACGQTVLPDRSFLIGQKSNATFCVIFKQCAQRVRWHCARTGLGSQYLFFFMLHNSPWKTVLEDQR